MSKRDYELVAESIDFCRAQLSPNNQRMPQTPQEAYELALEDVAAMVCNSFSRTNTAFRPALFLKACGVAP